MRKRNNIPPVYYKEDGFGHFVTGVTFGILIGGALVFFYGTKQGKKMRKEFSERGEDIFSSLQHAVANIEKQAESIEKKVTQTKKKRKEKKETEEKEKEERSERLPDFLATIQKRGRESVGSHKRKFFHRS